MTIKVFSTQLFLPIIMPRRLRYRYQEKPESLDIFPAFTDLMSNAFMILSLFLLLALFESQQLNKRLQSAIPIVIDKKSVKFPFISQSAQLTTQLKSYIANTVIPRIEETIKNHEIDFVQIIGHTDGEEINSTGNLDKILEDVAIGRNKKTVENLKPGSNTDLGLMRALAVIQEIENQIQKTDRYKNIKVKFRAYSAGQLYLPSDKLATINRNPDETRRRIEIRFIPPGQKQ